MTRRLSYFRHNPHFHSFSALQGSLMACSQESRGSNGLNSKTRTTTPPSPAQSAAASKSRTRKPSAKVLEAQQSLRTRTATRRVAQNEERTAAVRATQPSTQPTAPQATQIEAPPPSTAAKPVLSECETRVNRGNEVGRLIASLTETIAQQSRIITAQSSIIESIRNESRGRQNGNNSAFQNQYADLQAVVSFLSEHSLTSFLHSPPLNHAPPLKAPVLGIGRVWREEWKDQTLTPPTSSGNANRECRQLVI